MENVFRGDKVKKISVSLVASLFFLLGCVGPLVQNSEENTGTVILRIAQEGRTLVPATNLTLGKLEIVFTQGQTQILQTAFLDEAVSQSLSAGTWSLSVLGFNTDPIPLIIAQGSTSVNVTQGQTSQASITLTPRTGMGNLSLTATFEGNSLTSPSLIGSLTPCLGGAEIPLAFTLNSGTYSLTKSGIPAGYYILTVELFDGGELRATGVDALQIQSDELTGGSIALTLQGTLINFPPLAHGGNDMTAQVNTVVNFDGSASTDPDGTIVTYQWDNGLTGVAPSKTYTIPGTYHVILTVTDNVGAQSSDTVKVTIVEELAHRDFREERVYFMMTDRFSDGNLNNNNIWGDEYLPGGPSTQYQYDENKTGILSYYHGGDFAGIINNLDYIQDMGFTAIWITPVVKQPEGRRINNDNNYSASGFHGYWGYDFDKIDPHLGDSGKDSDNWADFDKLVAALHGRGMKLMLDIVVNHGHPGDSVKGSISKWADKWNKIIMNGQTWTFDKATDPLVNAAIPQSGMFSYPGTGGTWLIDLLDFNGNGPEANSAMPHLKSVYKRFIDHGVDAFRIDTAAYMSHNNWVDFTDAMDAHARSLGNDHFYMIGEAWTGDRGGSNNAVDIIYGSQGTNFHMLDLHNSSMDFPGWLSGVFKGDKGFEDTQVTKIFGPQGDQSGIYDPTYLGTFVDNHDVYRANGVLTQTQYMNNLSYIYLFRGVPIVYYGTEAMYSWSGAIATTNKEDVCARWMLGEEGINYVKTNKPIMYQHIKMLNQIRADFPVLQKGQQTNLVMSGDKAVVKRVFGGLNGFVALSKGAGYSDTQSIPNGTYTLVTPNSAAGTYSTQVVTVSTGSYTFTVPGNSFSLLLQ